MTSDKVRNTNIWYCSNCLDNVVIESFWKTLKYFNEYKVWRT